MKTNIVSDALIALRSSLVDLLGVVSGLLFGSSTNKPFDFHNNDWILITNFTTQLFFSFSEKIFHHIREIIFFSSFEMNFSSISIFFLLFGTIPF